MNEPEQAVVLSKEGAALPPRIQDRWNSGYKKRLMGAFAVAVVSDALSVWFEFTPPLQWGLDIITAALLFILLGLEWAILPGLVAEAIPGVALLPTWVLVVSSIAAWGAIRPHGKNEPGNGPIRS